MVQLILIVTFLSMLPSLANSAEPSSLPSSIHITADKLDYVKDPKNPNEPAVMVLTGKVVVTQNNSRLMSDRIVITERSVQDRVIEAVGTKDQPVLFEHLPEPAPTSAKKSAPVKGQAERITTETNNETVVLQGNAILTQEQDKLSAQTIFYNKTSGKYQAFSPPSATLSNPSRVQLIFNPKP